MADELDVKTYAFSELYRHQRQPESALISHGILKQGSMMVLGGPPKAYKSFVLLAIAKSLTTATNLFAAVRTVHGREKAAEVMFEVDRPRRVLFFEQEIGIDDLEDRIVPWYETLPPAQQKLFTENFFSHSLDGDLRFDRASGAEKLESIIRKIQPEVVIFDPLIEFHDADENSPTAMAGVLKNFMTLCRRCQVTPILSHHEGKEGLNPRRGGDRLRGASSLYGKGDTFLNLSVVNRRSMRIAVEFTLRRGRPLPSLMIQLDPNTLACNFLCWQGSKEWKANKRDDSEDVPQPEIEWGEINFKKPQ